MQLKLHMVTIEDLMPQEHFLRKLEAALDLSFVYEETSPLYSRKYGRPPIDPVVLVKYLLVGFLYGIPSERQIEQRVQTDVALRWYLGLDLFDRVPDHSTISQLRRRKPSFRKVFRRLFEEVVRQCVAAGLVSGRLAVTDSTHVKANASQASEELVEMPEEAGVYWERLDAYEEEGLEELERRTGKRRKKRTKQIKRDNRRSKKRVSRTDPESGHMKRPGKPEGPHYLSHQTLDGDYGIITGLTVTPGDVYDSVPYLDQLEHIHQSVIPIQAAAADSAYDFPLAHRVLEEHGIDFYVRPQAVYDRTQVEFKRDAFRYDQEKDRYICPNGKTLRAKRLYRSDSGLFWEYWAEREDCRACPLREKCLSANDRQGARKLSDSYFKPSVQRHLSRWKEPDYKQALKQRQIWCEGTFAIQKRCHNLTRVLRRGLEAAEDHCLLSATALNLRRMIWAIT
ncbi:MAG TPA: IS1182 family transposase [Candidatus Pelethomonas intestinigallinarum]|nr:IS1182 family transposase [Candidatus Pelethomonas intestinigallinarum]